MAWPEGDSIMAARVRDHDWASTPLGAIETWSAELRSAAALVLDAGLPMALLWGESAIVVHNDAFLDVLGERPAALGRSFRDVWNNVWDVVGPFVDKAYAGESSFVRDFPVQSSRNGQSKQIYYTFSFSPVRTADGRIAGVIDMLFDTTEQVVAALTLRSNEERQRFFLTLADALRPIEDEKQALAAGLELISAQLGNIGTSYCEIAGDGDSVRAVHTHPQTSERRLNRLSDFGARMLASVTAGENLVIGDRAADPQMTAQERDALEAVDVRALAVVPLHKRGRLVALIAVHQDKPRSWTDEEMRLAEEAGSRLWSVVARCRALAARRRFERLVETSGEFVGMCDEQLVPFYVNAAGLRLAGLPDMKAARSFPITVLLIKEDADFVRDVLLPQVHRDGGGEAELRFWHGVTGRMHWAICSVVLLAEEGDEPAGYAIVARDITDRKHAEMALRDSEERLRRFGDASSDILWIRDAETLQLTYVTAAFERVYGVAREEILSGDDFHNWAELVLPEDRSEALSHIALVRAGQQVSFEYRIRRPCDGMVRWVRNTDFPIRDEEGGVRSIGGISQDVTELKSAQDAHAEAERRQRALIEGIPQLVWRATAGGRWTWASPQWTSYTGLSVADSLDFGWLEALHPDDRHAARAGWDEADGTAALDMETRLCSADEGRYRWFSTRAEPVRDRHGKVVEWLGTSTDIDDLRQLQETQRVLVAELQHRTRNLIGVIRSVSDQTMTHASSTEEFRTAFRHRLNALSRVQGLLSQSGDERVTIGDVVSLELQALGPAESGRVSVEGAAVPLRKSMVQTLALAVHELATNARKYGALSQENGRLRIHWTLLGNEAGERRLRLDWIESGVDMGARTDERAADGGYGRELIERALPYALKARTCYELGESGLRCTIDLPLPAKGDVR